MTHFIADGFMTLGGAFLWLMAAAGITMVFQSIGKTARIVLLVLFLVIGIGCILTAQNLYLISEIFGVMKEGVIRPELVFV